MLKKILDYYEGSTHMRLRKVCTEYGASVFSKVRLADIFPIEGSGITKGEYRFALQSHLDFLIANQEHSPLFAVEFDGNSHRSDTQKRRDRIKDHLCERFGLPLLRINSRYLVQEYRNMDLLGWFVEVWFLQMDFDKQQEAGYIPYDECFDPFMIMGIAGEKADFPFWLSAPLLIKIQNLFKAGKCKDIAPSHIVGRDENGNYHAIGWLRITDDIAVLEETAMRSQRLPIILSDILGEIIVYEVYKVAVNVINKESKGRAIDEVKARVESFKNTYKTMSAVVVANALGSTTAV